MTSQILLSQMLFLSNDFNHLFLCKTDFNLLPKSDQFQPDLAQARFNFNPNSANPV